MKAHLRKLPFYALLIAICITAIVVTLTPDATRAQSLATASPTVSATPTPELIPGDTTGIIILGIIVVGIILFGVIWGWRTFTEKRQK